MNTLEIILVVFFTWAALFACGISAFHIVKTKLDFKERMCKAHREIWMYYQNNIDKLNHLFDDDDKITNEENQFLTFLFIHVELAFELKKCDMIPRDSKYKQDWKECIKHKKFRKYWEATKQYRPDKMVKYFDKLIND